jgi:hypothetical protein
MPSLADRIRASREEWVKADGFDLNVRRPTALQLTELYGAADRARVIMGYVVDWKVPEKDIVPGGGGDVPPFEADAFREWAEDRTDLLNDLSAKVTDIINRHFKAEQDAEKKS